jgi:isocitrate dehydrogenase kinase/phosphatase
VRPSGFGRHRLRSGNSRILKAGAPLFTTTRSGESDKPDMIQSSLPDTSDLASQKNDYAALIACATEEAGKIKLAARWILQEFDDYFMASRQIPKFAKEAFEQRDPRRSLALSKQRLFMYIEGVLAFRPQLKKAFPELADNEPLWSKVEKHYMSLIHERYEADLAFAYIHSVRRKIYREEWTPVAYDFSEWRPRRADVRARVYRTFAGGARISTDTVSEILKIPGFATPYRNFTEEAALVAERINNIFSLDGLSPDRIQSLEIINAGFYRNRGAYLVGRIVFDDTSVCPIIISLVNEEHGIEIDAVLTSEADAHNLFSSTLANFHVSNEYYHELAAFLYSIMPGRPLGLHYSTIGYNHLGKFAVLTELKNELGTRTEVFQTAVGFPGTVTIAFAGPSSSYNLKVIRDKPTAQYKWGKFQGIEAVLDKYRSVHEINRAGSMLDNVLYYNLRLEKKLFAPSLLDQLLTEAGRSVSLKGDYVIFKHLIAQLKIKPLPVFLETASPDDARTAIVNLGYSIKNNMAANIYNKDLDARNYGVSKFLRVFLYDYDAIERLTEVKIRSNRDRIDGEEDPPDWYFEDGVVLLPEEIEFGLRISNKSLLEIFRQVHGDLLTTEYWSHIKNDLRAGKVPRLHLYPEERKLNKEDSEVTGRGHE